MNRISFRQGMLLGFMLIVLLLGGVAIQSWLVVERLVDQSRRSSEQAIQLTAAIQELGERTVDIERSARQYLVLDNPVFRQRFDEHLAQSLMVVERLDGMAAEPLPPLLGGWRMVAEALRSGLEQNIPQAEIIPLLARLAELNGLLKQAGQRWVEEQNRKIARSVRCCPPQARRAHRPGPARRAAGGAGHGVVAGAAGTPPGTGHRSPGRQSFR